MDTTNPLPVNAGLTARVVFVHECRDCRRVVEALCVRWAADPSVASFQCIASKKNHCCESGDALPRVAAPQPSLPELFESIKQRAAEVTAQLEVGHCVHGLTAGCCAACDPLPISDTNGTLGEFDLPNGFD